MKPVRFFCPRCSQPMHAPGEVRGHNVACPRCQEKIQVPLPQTFSPPDEPQTRVISLRRPARTRSRLGKWWPLMLPVVCVAAIASFAFVHLRSDANEKLVQPAAADDDDVPRGALNQLLADRDQATGIGHDRQSVIDLLSDRFGCVFEGSVAGDGSDVYQTRIAGVVVMLRGPADDLHAITVIGAFEGEFGTVTGMVLREVVAFVAPSWPVEEHAEWFFRAGRVAGNTDVSTVRDGIRVMVVSAPLEDATLRVISFRISGED